MELLKVNDLKKTYNARIGRKPCRALRGLSFTVDEGEFVAIMGASGSGKTTLLNIIASLDRPTAGSVLLCGRDFSTIRDRELAAFRRENLGFVFQDFNLLDSFSLRDNILLPLVLSEMPLAEMESRLKPIAQALGIESLLDKYPYEVSGGEKQRAAVARAVITEPRILLADEPTGALDSVASRNLLGQFSALNEQGQTILMVTHSANAASYASRVIFIRDGEIVEQLWREQEDRHKFFDRIVAALAASSDGGADIA